MFDRGWKRVVALVTMLAVFFIAALKVGEWRAERERLAERLRQAEKDSRIEREMDAITAQAAEASRRGAAATANSHGVHYHPPALRQHPDSRGVNVVSDDERH